MPAYPSLGTFRGRAIENILCQTKDEGDLKGIMEETYQWEPCRTATGPPNAASTWPA